MNQLYQYTQSGKIYLWSYINHKNFPGYNMSWGEGGRANFLLFLECLSGSETGEFRTLNALVPTKSVLAIPNNRNSGIHPITKLRIELSDDIDWSFTVDESSCIILVSRAGAQEWARAISLVAPQKEISFNDINFWW